MTAETTVGQIGPTSNTRLSAAAPDLLISLRAMVAMVERGWIPPEDVDPDSWDAACEAFRQSRTYALAKELLRTLDEGA